MAIRIQDFELPDETHNLYDVHLDNITIHTLVTHTPSFVDQWITEVEDLNRSNLHRLIIGLDVEWRPNRIRGAADNPVAVLQLCVGFRCLVFQILHAPSIPASLKPFLRNPCYSFVGVGIDRDVERLVEGYDLGVTNMVDLRFLAAEKRGNVEYRRAGIKRLTKELIGTEVEKPKAVTLSRWDNEWLGCKQVQYACLDAFLSYELGRVLGASPADRIVNAYYCGSVAGV